MKNSEIKALSLEELKEKLNTEQTTMQNLRFAHAISPLENPMKIRETKKSIARLNTEIRRREIEANS
ncbi:MULTISPECIES: 50S ribosomal protein L29 [Pontibacter]|jgi:large subunit ribosomal protein L29|uniref:Large ribosomal subunit protein uL29 n=3 Tax=Pontibacter TaxID=323449 RepID=A0A2N3UBI3_9BACT|nr:MULTISPECIES: 50S ribosomal protein L29 [Pontibacter]MDO6389406.1 50S ribosomal protein L29 [Pontibacter sp. BT731]PKV66734.1 LSU ribosomal protein L29P [Pontibacter ramchanderi]PVY43917.1 LSU ribosomal protein L29P [Pontibacter virosus]SIT91119.1 LSU ribosomal protein L29P [Pontibacter indicus]